MKLTERENFMKRMTFKKNTVFWLCFCFFAFYPIAQAVGQQPIFVIGQDIRSIDDYMSFLRESSFKETTLYPQGFMVYTAINDPRGLSEPVDHGAGINHADDTIAKYPNMRVVQIGLYMKHMLKLIAKGELDQNIRSIGQWIKDSDREVFLRIGYEFDNIENEYNPTDYVRAYRHIVDHLRTMDISNVFFVWHSIAWRDEDWPEYDLDPWYPGDEYVDWIALSFFDAYKHQERDVLTAFARQKSKPLMIAESSPFNQADTEQKLAWIDALFAYAKSADVRFLSYINVHWDHLPLFEDQLWGDARLEQDERLILRFQEKIDEFFRF